MKPRWVIVYTGSNGKEKRLYVKDERQGSAFISMMERADPNANPRLEEEA